MLKKVALIVTFTAGFFALRSPARAIDSNGPLATDASVCNKVFVKKGEAISFQQDSDEYGGSFIMEGNKVRGQVGTCTIKARQEDGRSTCLPRARPTSWHRTFKFSAKVIDDNTISRIFPACPTNLASNICAVRCDPRTLKRCSYLT